MKSSADAYIPISFSRYSPTRLEPTVGAVQTKKYAYCEPVIGTSSSVWFFKHSLCHQQRGKHLLPIFSLIFDLALAGTHASVSNRSPHVVQDQGLRTKHSLTNSDQTGATSTSPHLHTSPNSVRATFHDLTAFLRMNLIQDAQEAIAGRTGRPAPASIA
jgi:hypothetical protein